MRCLLLALACTVSAVDTGCSSTCSPESCAGCCQGDVCRTGNESAACGALGAACSVCSAETACKSGTCRDVAAAAAACSPSNCSGCCQGSLCRTGTEPSACGAIGAACSVCGASESCQAGVCSTASQPPPGGGADAGPSAPAAPAPVVAAGQTGVYDVAVDEHFVYWTTFLPSGGVFKAPLVGGTIQNLATGHGRPAAIAVDHTSVYWINMDQGGVMRVPIAGGGSTQLASGSLPVSLTLSGDYVYWVEHGSGAAQRVARGGGTTEWLGTVDDPHGVAVIGDKVYVSEAGAGRIAVLPVAELVAASQFGPSPGLLIDAQSVYFADQGLRKIFKAPRAGGDLAELATLSSPPVALALDASNVYFATSDGAIGAIGKSGGAITSLATAQSGASSLAVVSGSLYWNAGTQLRRTPVGSSAVTTVHTATYNIERLVAAGTHLFFGTTYQSCYCSPTAVLGDYDASTGGTRTVTTYTEYVGSSILVRSVDQQHVYAYWASALRQLDRATGAVGLVTPVGCNVDVAIRAGGQLFSSCGTSIIRGQLGSSAANTIATPGGSAYLQLEGSTLFYTDGPRVWRRDLDGAVAAQGGMRPEGIIAAGDRLLWTDADAGKIISLVPGSAPTVVAENQDVPWDLAADATHLYWTNRGSLSSNGSIRRAPLAGGAVETVLSGLGYPLGLALDAHFIYWANAGTGHVLRLAKP